MKDLYFCKNCGFLDEDQVEGSLSVTGIETRCCFCGEEAINGDEKLTEFGNKLLKVFHPDATVTF